jgi:DNA-binding transcriptional LysR family regulator
MAGAAQALGRTPAAVTQQLAKAERELKTTLVHRGPRGAALTAAGVLLARHGRIIDEETRRAALGLDGLFGRLSLRLRIGAFQAAALHLLPPALTALRHRYPDADLTVTDITSDQGIDEVVAGRLDVAVIASWDTPITPPDLVTVHPLLRDPMVVVLPDDHPALAGPALAGPALAGPAAVGLEQFRDEAWVTILAGHAARAQFDRVTAAAGFSPRIRFQTASYDVAQALVGTGIGVALVSRLALAHAPRTAHRPLLPPVPHRDLQVVTMTDAKVTPLVEVFLRLLRDVASDLESGWAAEPG